VINYFFFNFGFSSISNIFLSIIPAVISAVWFPESELAIASGIGAGGLMIGNAIGYLVPPMIVQGPKKAYNNETYPKDWANETYPQSGQAIEEVGKQLLTLFLIQAGINLVFFLLVIFAFPGILLNIS